MIKKIARKLGYTITSINAVSNLDNVILKENIEFARFYEICKDYTMTSIERLYASYCATEYVVNNNLPGDIVECGVWKGGSSMMIALVLNKYNVTNRKIYMYDTYEGMSEPDENDKDVSGVSAENLLKKADIKQQDSVWCYSSLDEVKANMNKTGFSQDNIVYVVGKVEETIPETIPHSDIALLRLDTDWYASTKQELEYLYPKLVDKGVLIIDDYGHWQGCRKAVDEYFAKENINILLSITDYTGRIAIKV